MTQYRSETKRHRRKDPDLDLNPGQVLAASGAATLGALLVKLLDIWGTVLGTAVLSVCTSIGAVLILRTMRRTREKVREQISVFSKAAGTRTLEDGTTVDLSRETVRLGAVEQVEPETARSDQARSRRRTLLAVLVSSVTVFALTMGALLLFGTVSGGDPTKYIIEQRPSTVYVTDDSTDEAPEEPATEDDTGPATDDATEEPPGEEPDGGSGDDPAEEEEEDPNEEEDADRGSGSEEPAAESEESAEAPAE